MFDSAKVARLEAANEALRERIADRDQQITAQQARIAHLETLLDQRSVDVLNTVLNRQGFAAVGEETGEPVKAEPPKWSVIDEQLYANWARDLSTACPELTMEQIREHYTREYGARFPVEVLI